MTFRDLCKKVRFAKVSFLRKRILPACLAVFLGVAGGICAGAASEKTSGTAGDPAAIKALLAGIETCYADTAFSARFHQTSTLAAMDITDTASGKIFVKPPDRMRWEYETPEKQTIITDGKTLWIYRPLDNQVMRGKAPAYLGGGQGGSFLSDIRTLKKAFRVTLESHRPNLPAVLRLTPKEPVPDLVELLVSVDPETFQIIRIVTRNPYNDKTQITLSDYRFDLTLDEDLFQMKIPESAEVFELEGE